MKLLNNSFLMRIALRIPFLIKLKRYFLAFKDSIRITQKTYSQYSEDRYVMGLLHGLSPKNGIYIEVGANQPTQISNTYLFYRLGFHGIVIEPNKEMTSLFKHFRPEDIHLEIGCADDSGVSKFKKADVSVLSGFTDDINVVANSQYWTPLLTVDEIWRDVGEKQMVFLLSIDTEGFDLIVLKGAEETLKHTAVVIIETNENDIIEVKTIMLQSGFKLVKTTACNYIWLNEDTAKKICQV